MTRFRLWLCVTGSIAALAALGSFLVHHEPAARSAPIPVVAATDPDGRHAGSAVCRECHPLEHQAWQASHHALAERQLDPARDAAAFRPERTVAHGTLRSVVREREGRLELLASGAAGTPETFRPARLIGVAPLEQLVVPFPGGRYQATSLAYDRARDDWFDVFAGEDRGAHEWGHWTNRGMTWNSMCASCHVTAYAKRYDPAADTYASSWLELGVGCEGCHGALAQHVAAARASAAAGRPLPPAGRPARLSPDLLLDACGACHARRQELTGAFRAGERFTDHFRASLPDDTDAYHADGQVRDEDFEHGSFLLSRMHGEGVRCTHCHDSHSGRLKLTGNGLCLSCHEGKIEPAAHSRHDPAGAGGQCVGCHMPQTTYMQRHPRRDHGFTVPDPLLTREHGIPNACNRCHADRDVDWALRAAEAWFGDRLERGTRARARAIAGARRGRGEVVPELIRIAATDRSGAWRAVASGLLGRWVDVPEVQETLGERLRDADPLARAAAVRALGPFAPARELLGGLLDDPSRLVRIEAAWALRGDIDLASRAGKELEAQLELNLDQPQGVLQKGLFLLDRGQPAAAEALVRKAIDWDRASAPIHQALALVLDAQARPADAIRALEEAARLEPGDPAYLFSLGLAHGAADAPGEAVKALEKACELDPGFARAWYNLGLARSRLGLTHEALAALRRAQAEDPHSPEYPHARAAIHLERGERDEAGAAALEALQLEPRFEPAAAILEELERREGR